MKPADCPHYTGPGAAAGNSTCHFFAGLTGTERMVGGVACIIVLILILAYLRRT